jgi:type VI protein secretion system component VasF
LLVFAHASDGAPIWAVALAAVVVVVALFLLLGPGFRRPRD